MFAQAPEESVQWASERMEIFNLKRRETLLSGGGPFKGLGLVLQGRMQAVDLTLDGREVALKTVEQNGLFGEENLLATRPLDLTWMAPAPASVAVMGARTAQDLLQQPDMLRSVAGAMAQQLIDQLQWQKILGASSVTSKVCNWLVFLSNGRADLQLPTHAEVAWRLNTTRESVTRVLQRLQAEGVLSRQDGRWKIQRMMALHELAKGDDK